MEMINEMIHKMEYFSSLLALLLGIFFGSAFMEESRKKKYSVISIGLAFVLAGIANEVFWKYKDFFAKEDTPFVYYDYGKNFFYIVLLILIQWIYFRRKYVLTLIATSIYVEILMVAEAVAWMFSMNWRGLVTYQRTILDLQLAIVIITVMTLLLHGVVPKIKISIVYLMLVEIFVVLMILINWVLVGGGESVLALKERFTDYYGIILYGGFFIFQVIVVFFVLKIAESHQHKQTTALIELNNKMLQKSLDETEQTFDLWRQSVHDYKNHVIVLKQLADENRMDEIKAFLEEENDTINKQLFMIRTGNSVVDTLVNLKRSLAEKYHIAFIVHGTLPEKLVVENMDLANILGNLLDNAIEASMKEQDGYIDLTLKQEKSFLLLTIRNKCTDASAKEIDKSSKENPEFHGIGLKSVKRAVKKYDGQINVEQNEHEFVVTIMIQNKQEN